MLDFFFEDPCYTTFHDEEWGVPVHDDKYVPQNLIYISLSKF